MEGAATKWKRLDVGGMEHCMGKELKWVVASREGLTAALPVGA
jgi:hypothetical protein